MRIVIDSNILARAPCGPPSPAAELLIRALRAPYTICMSPILLDELNRILRYDRVRKMHRMQDSEIDLFIVQLRLSSLIVEPAKPTAISTDPVDDWVIATAVEAGSSVICTLDRHLRTPLVMQYRKEQHGIEVLTDVELLDGLKNA